MPSLSRTRAEARACGRRKSSFAPRKNVLSRSERRRRSIASALAAGSLTPGIMPQQGQASRLFAPRLVSDGSTRNIFGGGRASSLQGCCASSLVGRAAERTSWMLVLVEARMPYAKLPAAKISRNRPSHRITGYERFLESFRSLEGESFDVRARARTGTGCWMAGNARRVDGQGREGRPGRPTGALPPTCEIRRCRYTGAMATPPPAPLTANRRRARLQRIMGIAERLGFIGIVEYRHVYSNCQGDRGPDRPRRSS